MIVFSGELSEKSKKAIRKEHQKKSFKLGVIFSILLCIPLIILTIKVDYLFALGFIFLVAFPFAAGAPIQKKYRENLYPKKIEFTEDEIVYYGNDFSFGYGVDCIKKIVDNEDYYKIYIRSGIKSGVEICQKDLITEGSLEEFEEKFADFLIDYHDTKTKTF